MAVKVAVGLVKLLNCEASKLGPLKTDQLPVPVVGVFPDNKAPDKLQTLCVEVFVAVLGAAVTVIVAFAKEGAQGELPMVQRTT